MSNGARPGVLVVDLLRSDGPFVGLADDFVTRTCSGCRRPMEQSGIHYDAAYLCTACWGRIVA
jgi:hypothetical protein